MRPAFEKDSLPAAHGRQGRGTWLRRLQGAFQTGSERGALGRWEFGGIVRRQSGPHLTPVGSSILTRRADYAGGGIIVGPDLYL